jgi:hypothetical protein
LLFPDADDDMIELGYEEERMLFYNTGEVSEEVRELSELCTFALPIQFNNDLFDASGLGRPTLSLS